MRQRLQRLPLEDADDHDDLRTDARAIMHALKAETLDAGQMAIASVVEVLDKLIGDGVRPDLRIGATLRASRSGTRGRHARRVCVRRARRVV